MFIIVELPTAQELYEYMTTHSQRTQNIGVLDEVLDALIDLVDAPLIRPEWSKHEVSQG